jgi:hypothetical protein
MVIESPASRRPRAGARLRWSRPHVAPVEGPGLLPGLSIPWSQGPSEVPSPPGPATARTSAASIDPRRPPGASLLAVLPPVHRPTGTALPRGRSPPGAMSCPEQPSDSCSRRSLLQCNSQSDMWHEQAVVVHLRVLPRQPLRTGPDSYARPGAAHRRTGRQDRAPPATTWSYRRRCAPRVDGGPEPGAAGECVGS